jgi:uncharacterized protein (TIGR00290 family)
MGLQMRVAVFSGGKDSVYAVMKMWPIDLFIYFVYEFPRPSPHTINIGKIAELATSLGAPLLIKKLTKGHESEEAIRLFKQLNVNEIVAGDVFLDRSYLDKIAHECNAFLYEPLWMMNSEALLREEIKNGIRPLIIGIIKRMETWLGKIIDEHNINVFINDLKINDVDPVGERGEFHTLVLASPFQSREIDFEIVKIKHYDNYVIAQLI